MLLQRQRELWDTHIHNRCCVHGHPKDKNTLKYIGLRKDTAAAEGG